MHTSLALNSSESACLWLLSAGVKTEHHHAQFEYFFKLIKCVYDCVCLRVSMCVWVHVSMEAKMSVPLELELQAVVNRLTWVLRTKLWSSVREHVLLIAEPLLQLLVKFLRTLLALSLGWWPVRWRKIKLLKGNIFIIKNTIQTGEMGGSLKHFSSQTWGLGFGVHRTHVYTK